MKDKVGRFLMHWRICRMRPYMVGRLLDIGCGTNELARAHDGYAVGVDVYQWGDVDLVVKDSATIPLADRSFDTVTIVAALNHIPNRDAVVREAYRLLKPGGRIIITMIPPFVAMVWHRLREPWDVDQSVRGMQPGEVYGLSHAEVTDFLKNAGFTIATQKRFMLGINRLTVGIKPGDGYCFPAFPCP